MPIYILHRDIALASSHFIEGDKIKGRRCYAEIMRIRLQPRGERRKKRLGDERAERALEHEKEEEKDMVARRPNRK
jgi:hypothetical protein